MLKCHMAAYCAYTSMVVESYGARKGEMIRNSDFIIRNELYNT